MGSSPRAASTTSTLRTRSTGPQGCASPTPASAAAPAERLSRPALDARPYQDLDNRPQTSAILDKPHGPADGQGDDRDTQNPPARRRRPALSRDPGHVGGRVGRATQDHG